MGPGVVAAVHGVASFTGLALTSAGSGYTLLVSGDGLTAATWSPARSCPIQWLTERDDAIGHCPQQEAQQDTC
jgi:hypothetical protein